MNNHKRNILFLGSIIFLILVAIVWVLFQEITDPKKGRSNITQSEIENFAGMSLPAETSSLQAHLSSFQDQILYTRFELPVTAVDQLLESISWGEQPAVTTTIPVSFQHDNRNLIGWWNVEDAQKFEVGRWQHTTTSGTETFSEIVLDISDPGTVIVYVVTFNT